MRASEPANSDFGQIDTLSETLQRECGTFSQPGDVVVYKVRN